MKYCRINLSETNYTPFDNFLIFVDPPVVELQGIYKKYCDYKKFESVMPIFDSQFVDIKNDVYGYLTPNQQLVAFSIVRRYDDCNVESLQFAWDYQNPELRLGIRSLEHECALYKTWGFQYLYLGEAHEYKSQLAGYEILGSLNV
jgi:hypothetical protein